MKTEPENTDHEIRYTETLYPEDTHWPSVESQKKFWVDNETVVDHATNETRGDWGIEGTCVDVNEHDVDWQALAISRYERMTALWHENDKLKSVLKDIELRATQDRIASNIGKKNQTDFLRGSLERIGKVARTATDASNLGTPDSTTADPKPETGLTLDQIEATTDWMDHERNVDRGDLRDDGRSDGYGESYAERNA